MKIGVYDIEGRLVRTLLDGEAGPGSHEVTWDCRDDAGNALAGGVYLTRIETADGVATGKVVFIGGAN